MAGAFEVAAPAFDGHVGDADEVGEDDAEVFVEFAAVVGFEGVGGRGEGGAAGVVNEREGEVGVRAVAHVVEGEQALDRVVEGAAAALLVDVVGGVAGQARR